MIVSMVVVPPDKIYVRTRRVWMKLSNWRWHACVERDLILTHKAPCRLGQHACQLIEDWSASQVINESMHSEIF